MAMTYAFILLIPAFGFLAWGIIAERLLYLVTFIVLLIAAFAVASKAEAGPYIAASVGSYHSDRSQDWNEFNPGLAVGYQGKNWGGEFGVYKNSYGDRTNYGLVSLTTNTPVRAGVFLGVANGYEMDALSVNGLLPLVGVQISSGPFRARISPTANGLVFAPQLVLEF